MIYKITSHLDGKVASVYCFLEGQAVHLSYDGEKKYLSTDIVEVAPGKLLDVAMRVYGEDGSRWKLTLHIARQDDEACAKDYVAEGRIGKDQTCRILDRVTLPAAGGAPSGRT